MIDSKVLPDLEYAQIQIRTAQNPLGTTWNQLVPLGICKGYCRRAGRGAECGTSRGSKGFSLLCNDRLNKSAYLAGDPKRKG